jgi:hypothetical protein
MKKIAIALIATFAALSVWAQPSLQTPAPVQTPQSVGMAVNVTGLVTQSFRNQLSNVVEGAPLYVDARIMTSSTGGVTLDFDNGCDVTLKENESIKVSDDKDCAALWAAVTPVGGPRRGNGRPPPALIPGLVIGAGGAAAIIISNRDKNKASGS